ncbi:hypothetical protein ACXP2N_08130 [Vibrio alginolyticus]|uniref:hypothetical protein n=1 Tax=Vibrio alginolyticus TaxID=663 RepID=UPI001BD4BFBE|nr:hypothetical protein [Vibrio alginolyticus]MBS9939794.1 hypothetical protein [Vibrio alginolyticus]
MATILRLNNASFKGDLPNINPFVNFGRLDFGFDFRERESKYLDLAGNHKLKVMKNDINNNEIHVEDETIIDSLGGLGISPILGFLEIDYELNPIPIDGTEKFTLMFVGGQHPSYVWDDIDTAGSSASTSRFYDYGTVVSDSGFALTSRTIGRNHTRVVGQDVLTDNLPSPQTPTVIFLTFDGDKFTMVNKTLGTSSSWSVSTNGGLIDPIPVRNDYSNYVVVGHHHKSSTLSAFPPAVYQLARWNDILQPSEIEAQYQNTKMSFPSLGL